MHFFRGYHSSELGEDGEPLPNGSGLLIVWVVLMMLAVGLALLIKACA